LKKHRLAVDQKGKQKRKKWIKYERKHTNSLWHTDWYMVMDSRWRGKWLIVYLDDASRFVTGWGLFDEPTTENTISVLDKAMKYYGKPSAILTDHGSQFYLNYGYDKSPGITLFQEYLTKHKTHTGQNSASTN